MRLAGARTGKETSKSTHSFSTKQTHRDVGSVEMIANDLRTLRSHFLKHSELFVFQLKKKKKTPSIHKQEFKAIWF